MATVGNAASARALVFEGPGVLTSATAPPPNPAAGEAVLRVRRAGICGTDLHIFQGHFAGRVAPGSIIGHEAVAEVVASPVGSGFGPGQRVVVEPLVSCGACRACRDGASYLCSTLKILGVDLPGAMQEFWCAPADRLLAVPDSVSDDDAALLEPLAVAVHDVTRARVAAGDAVLVFGGGPIGAVLAQVCRHRGARVVVAEVNPFRVDLLRELELRVIGPGEDLPGTIDAMTGGDGVDIAFEVTGAPAAMEAVVPLVRVHGHISVIGIHDEPRPVDLRRFFLRELSLHGSRLYTRAAWEEALELAAAKAVLLSPLVTHRITLDEVQSHIEAILAGAPAMKVLVDLTREA